jgi:hypothetical protein
LASQDEIQMETLMSFIGAMTFVSMTIVRMHLGLYIFKKKCVGTNVLEQILL